MFCKLHERGETLDTGKPIPRLHALRVRVTPAGRGSGAKGRDANGQVQADALDVEWLDDERRVLGKHLEVDVSMQ